jgi:hypothetical protein
VSGYSRLDRTLHRLAFAGTDQQKALADLEDRMFRARLEATAADRPVFVTSLPRAGTTLLLESLDSLDEFATHTYRHMPFVMVPMLWESISRGFRKADAPRERAHGDGMLVTYDSPEAFEEILWHAFWPTKYRDGRIAPWTEADADAEFESFFRQHLRKIVALGTAAGGRYVSKNNVNVARLPYLLKLFGDVRIVVPFREPRDHVRSMARQHANFSALHAEDDFARLYMEKIGHRDFGAALAPIDFGGWTATVAEPASDERFWWRYWIAAFRHLLAFDDPRLVFVDYDRCCTAPAEQLTGLAERLGLAAPERLVATAERYRPAVRHDAVPPPDDTLAHEAYALHRALEERANR